MRRFNKKTMSLYSREYDELLNEEINVWSKYISSNSSISDFEELKSTHVYSTYRKGTIEKELTYIESLPPDSNVLELGSADGWLTNAILKLPNIACVTSIDIALEDNKKRYNARAEAVRGDLNKMEEILFDKKYDCIITHGTLHHLVDPMKTLTYCVENLIKKDGLIIINDTWLLESIQLKVNSFAFIVLNKIPHALLSLKIRELVGLITVEIPKILFNKDYAESIAHAHSASPFESISSAEDYKEIYKRKDLSTIFFKRYAAIPGVQNAWMSSPFLIKKVIQTLDNFLIKSGVFCGDYHITIFRKK